MKHLTKSILCTLGIMALLALSACNTIDGAGQDIERTGEAIQDSAR